MNATFHLEFTLRQGDFRADIAVHAQARALALVGPSGSGKTSVLEAIAGIRTPCGGRIAIDGRVLFDAVDQVNVPARLRGIGYVPQETLLFPHLDVRSNIEYGAPRRPLPDAAAILDQLDLGPLMTRRVASLSGGERQRVALARALHSGPDLLLLDEPLAAVDVGRRTRIIEALLSIRDALGVPLIYVTHSSEEARIIADYAVALDNGQVVDAGVTADVLRHMATGQRDVSVARDR